MSLSEVGVEVLPELRNGKLARVLWKEKCSAGDTKEIASKGVVVGELCGLSAIVCLP